MMAEPVGQKPHPLRRQYIVNKGYQWRFIALLCGVALIIGIVAAGAVYTVVDGVLEEAMYRIHLPTGELWKMIQGPLLRVKFMLAGGSLVLAVLAVAFVMHRAEKALKAIENETRALDASRSAPTDHAAEALWHDVSGPAAEGLRKLFHPFVDAADDLDRLAAGLEEAMNSDAAPDGSALAGQVAGVIEGVEEGSRAFTC